MGLIKKDFRATGPQYHQEDFMTLAIPNDATPSDDGFSRVYKYNFKHSPVTLVADPENEHDPNAIRVMVDGIFIGYVPADECLDVKRILNECKVKYISCWITGGEYILYNTGEKVREDCEQIKADVRIGYVE